MKNSELNVGGLIVHHQGNHNERGNPHPQYVLDGSDIHEVSSGTSTSQNKWILACSLIVTKSATRDLYGYVEFVAYNGKTGSGSVAFTVYAKARYAYSGGVGNAEIRTDYAALGLVMGVISVNDSTTYRLDVYIKNTLSYGQYTLRETYRYDYFPEIAFAYGSSPGTWLTDLPTGTQITPTSSFADAKFVNLEARVYALEHPV